MASYRVCPECEASFKLEADEPFPPHTFLGKPCSVPEGQWTCHAKPAALGGATCGHWNISGGIRVRGILCCNGCGATKKASDDRAAKLVTLTADQLEALRVFAEANGSRWKGRLNLCWQNDAHYRAYAGTDDEASLQQVRNTFGPSWLVAFSFKDTKTYSRKL